MNRFTATTAEAAEHIGMSRQTMLRWAKAGLVREAWWHTPKGQYRWDLRKLDELLGIEPTGDLMHDADTPLRPAIVAVIVTSNRGVLAERRNDGRPLWTFPSGEAEPREAPADTAIREVKEETGLSVKVSHIIGERDHPQTGRHMIYVAARPEHGTKVFVGDEDELAEVKWVSLAEAEQLMPTMYGLVREHLTTVLRSDKRAS